MSRRGSGWWPLAILAALAWAGPVAAQARTGGAGGGASGGAGGGFSGGISGGGGGMSGGFSGGGGGGLSGGGLSGGGSLQSQFSLNNANFSGGGNMSGNISGGGGRNAGGRSGAVGQTSFLGPTWSSPLALGWASNSSNGQAAAAFGQAMFNLQQTNTNTANRGGGNLNRGVGGNANLQNVSQAAPFASSAGIRRNIGYVTDLAPTFLVTEPPPVAQVRDDLQRIFLEADVNLPSRNNIQVIVDGPAVVLRGRVADDHERRLAEAVLRLSPGVRDVRNELVAGR
jgi:hypothetical protein